MQWTSRSVLDVDKDSSVNDVEVNVIQSEDGCKSMNDCDDVAVSCDRACSHYPSVGCESGEMTASSDIACSQKSGDENIGMMIENNNDEVYDMSEINSDSVCAHGINDDVNGKCVSGSVNGKRIECRVGECKHANASLDISSLYSVCFIKILVLVHIFMFHYFKIKRKAVFIT